MRGNKIIAIVGMSEAEDAHLRLLMRKLAPELDHTWRWGDESSADLIIVDVRSFAGQMARTRAQGSGMRYAIFSDVRVDGADLILNRPLQRANVIEVLNNAARTLGRDPQIGANTADFYTRDLGEGGLASARSDELEELYELDAGLAPQGSPVGLDELLRSEPVELRGHQIWTPSVTPSAPVGESASGESSRHPAQAPLRAYANFDSMLAETAPRELREFLSGELLQAPVRFTLSGAPALTLDPKNQVAHAPAALGALAPYCHARWRQCDWQPLTNAELAEVRETQQAYAYSRLIWLQVLSLSGGHLASHLDPGGTYRLKQWVEIDKDLGRYFRIASAMLQPARLHEIAAAAAAPMADVFDLINAYDAVGLIEWQPRPRRDDHADKKKPSSLLGRLRRPFGKT